MKEELFNAEFYRELIEGQAQTNAALTIIAERMSVAADSLSHIEPILSRHEKRIAKIEKTVTTTKKVLVWISGGIFSMLGGLLTYWQQITDILSKLSHPK